MQNKDQEMHPTNTPSSIETAAEQPKPTTLQPAQSAEPNDAPLKEIQVTSIFTAKPGLEVHFRQELLEYVKQVRKNDHCKEITVLTENGHNGRFLLHSRWDSEAAFIRHLGSPLVREYALKNQKFGDPKLLVHRWTVLQEN